MRIDLNLIQELQQKNIELQRRCDDGAVHVVSYRRAGGVSRTARHCCQAAGLCGLCGAGGNSLPDFRSGQQRSDPNRRLSGDDHPAAVQLGRTEAGRHAAAGGRRTHDQAAVRRRDAGGIIRAGTFVWNSRQRRGRYCTTTAALSAQSFRKCWNPRKF